MLGTFPKGSADILIYTVDWSAWLTAGDTLASSNFVLPTGVTLVSQTQTPTLSIVKIAGGTLNAVYTIPVTITTAVSGETKGETFILRITH